MKSIKRTAIAALIAKLRGLTAEDVERDFQNTESDGFPLSIRCDFDEYSNVESISLKPGHHDGYIHIGMFEEFEHIQAMEDHALEYVINSYVEDQIESERESEHLRAEAAQFEEEFEEMVRRDQ